MPKPGDSKTKSKILKVEIGSESDSDVSEHELSYYMKDKVKLMKEVLKLIKPKKIKAMAPDCIKHLDIVEINSMLLEELLGISNKRLQYIFNGENVDRETSSSDSDDGLKPIDIISLDDISDDDIEVTINPSETVQNKCRKHKSQKIKKEFTSSEKKPKLIKDENEQQQTTVKESEREKLMSVLELLELQARARAIKSQLVLEANKQTQVKEPVLKHEDDSDPDAVIIASPEYKEIVLTSSESEDESSRHEKISSEKSIVTGTELNVSSSDVTAPHTAETDSVVIESVIILDDDHDKIESNLKQQKLLSKVKKIKLNRHKTLTTQGNIVKNEITKPEQKRNNNGTDDCNKSEICSQESSGDNIINKASLNDLVKNDTSHDTLVGSLNAGDAQLSSENHNEANCEIKVNNREITSPHSEVDNDEIVVINLDEDEMKGIEID